MTFPQHVNILRAIILKDIEHFKYWDLSQHITHTAIQDSVELSISMSSIPMVAGICSVYYKVDENKVGIDIEILWNKIDMDAFTVFLAGDDTSSSTDLVQDYNRAMGVV